MSYPRDLDEYTDDELQGEINRRSICVARGFCSYCGGNLRENTTSGWSSCRFPDRHGREDGHRAHLVLGAVRHDGSVVSQADLDALAEKQRRPASPSAL